MRRLALAILAIGCSEGERSTPTPASPEVQGSLTVNGTTVAIEACRPGRGVTTFVELVTARGVLRFEDRQLFWQPDRAAVSRGAVLACAKLDRSWGGGQRADGTAYFRGMLDFRCTGTGPVVLAGKVTLDCGNITPDERAQLDANRKQMRDEQAGSSR